MDGWIDGCINTYIHICRPPLLPTHTYVYFRVYTRMHVGCCATLEPHTGTLAKTAPGGKKKKTQLGTLPEAGAMAVTVRQLPWSDAMDDPVILNTWPGSFRR